MSPHCPCSAFCYECIGRSSFCCFWSPFYSRWALAFLTESLPAQAMFLNSCTWSLHLPPVYCLLMPLHHKFPAQSCGFSGKFADLPEYWEGLLLHLQDAVWKTCQLCWTLLLFRAAIGSHPAVSWISWSLLIWNLGSVLCYLTVDSKKQSSAQFSSYLLLSALNIFIFFLVLIFYFPHFSYWIMSWFYLYKEISFLSVEETNVLDYQITSWSLAVEFTLISAARHYH